MPADTIAAIATATGAAGIGVIRISGQQALSIGNRITGKALKPRLATYAHFRNLVGETLDRGIALYFKAPHSYTGEDVVELQGHGGIYVLKSLLKLILSHGARQARPGEFTERAFLNDKIDLLQAEAVADLIEARSGAATKAALRSLSGEFSQAVAALQAAVTHLRVYTEAALDFSEEDIDFFADGKIEQSVLNLLVQIEVLQSQVRHGKLLHDGVNVVLVGEPNVGKSSLMNRLLGHERAIVTDEAGTTRDTVEETLLIADIPVKLSDTAGLRQTDNVVEQAGIERTQKALAAADVIIWLRDSCSLHDSIPDVLSGCDVIEVHNKVDLLHDSRALPPTCSTIPSISAKTGQGIEYLRHTIAGKIVGHYHEEGVFSARQRHLSALLSVKAHVESAHQHIQSLQTAELLAEELRLAQQALAGITGEYSSDDLLGAIFSQFCIGK